MTREEALKYFEPEFDGEENWMPDITEYSFKVFIDKIYDSLEARIAELEAPKTCLQCIHHTFETEHYGLCHRNGNPEDTAYYWTCGGYEPKDIK